MTSRSDIIDGSLAEGRKYGLIYTRKCGWIDLGHANPDGAKNLWHKISDENGEQGDTLDLHRISYQQMMGNKHIKVGSHKRYDIKKGLNTDKKKSVALAIFLDVSHTFETMQSSWPFRWVTDSGYSAEDLTSNLVGFYRAVNPDYPYIQCFLPVSKDLALQIWDKFGAVGTSKNYSTTPYLYPEPPAPGGPVCGVLPSVLNTIEPAKQGSLFTVVQ